MVRSKPTKKSKSAASRIKAAGIAQSQSKAAKTNQGRAKTVSGTDEEVNDEFNDEDGGINDEISNEDDEIDFLGDLSKDQQNPHHGRQEQEVRERQNPHRDRQEQEVRERQNPHRDRQEQERECQNPHRGRQEQERERQNPHRGRQEQERERQNPLCRHQEQEGREIENRERIKRRRNEREDDQDYREKEDDNYSVPPQFESMTNQLQICNWLVDHPDILQLATQMLNMKDSTSQLALAVQQPAHAPSTASNEKYRLIDEEIKCLFLRSRFPPGLVFEKLVRKIFPEFETYSSTAKSIIDRCRKSFSDYRYQLRVGGTITETETQVEITNFISCEVAIKRILNRYFSAVDISEISEISMDKLIEFSRECFSIAWEERNETNTKAFYNQIKRLDKNTENLEIPSRSGKNFASSLKF
ncbi:uncharacterized protein OCT59_012174 [Rhizophagus irregularis]|uniref:uncharacterized protein n=1 Tax=Rhizophagus irregularis TaxID=588596 RepID=UPI0019F09089|nr:hypothetical protein OCT59_012174 [Rhizophagus irregularis]GBC40033.2 hypothetical protein GLOIN_2v1884319 [Rhizophagus irregularis DAOM 181602=DAOM 197198]